MSTTHTPAPATADDAGPISRSLARAFQDDPMMGWFFPEASSREASLVTYFTVLFTGQYLHNGVCERTGGAAAFWVPPEQARAVPDEETVGTLLGLLGDRAGAFRAAVETAAAHAPREPHWSLALIGADPAVRGLGQGGALLRSGLAKADATGHPVYLESSQESNIPVYEHFGFAVREEVPLPGGGPVLWSMWREPRPRADR
ncbi:GNAT family N-acetyltransferase [Streptomyces sp. NPDC002454]|uniref:GNAT family N-acetyltransferase n=1 Tax=Streptomyces sp. NPDC002490 TaxID=3154416 RepID=UPI00331AF584